MAPPRSLLNKLLCVIITGRRSVNFYSTDDGVCSP